MTPSGSKTQIWGHDDRNRDCKSVLSFGMRVRRLYFRRYRSFAPETPTTSCFSGSHARLRPSFIELFAKMHDAVEMYPCSMSDTGWLRASIEARKFCI